MSGFIFHLPEQERAEDRPGKRREFRRKLRRIEIGGREQQCNRLVVCAVPDGNALLGDDRIKCLAREIGVSVMRRVCKCGFLEERQDSALPLAVKLQQLHETLRGFRLLHAAQQKRPPILLVPCE